MIRQPATPPRSGAGNYRATFRPGKPLMDSDYPHSPEASAPRWRPLSPRQRRVIGVLIEKAKTTPDAYPLSLNAVTTGCNQKSNRSPQMQLTPDDVETVLDELRDLGAVVEVQTSGRVPKYRHLMYEWLGVDKVELAVMAELLLRGEQTVGELRARSSRMETIASQEALRPVLHSLIEKKLVLALSPEGRGQVVSHGLYKERELAELHTRAHSLAARRDDHALPHPPPDVSPPNVEDTKELRAEILQLKQQLATLRDEVEQLKQALL